MFLAYMYLSLPAWSDTAMQIEAAVVSSLFAGVDELLFDCIAARIQTASQPPQPAAHAYFSFFLDLSCMPRISHTYRITSSGYRTPPSFQHNRCSKTLPSGAVSSVALAPPAPPPARVAPRDPPALARVAPRDPPALVRARVAPRAALAPAAPDRHLAPMKYIHISSLATTRYNGTGSS